MSISSQDHNFQSLDKKKSPSELRLDIVSGDWVVIATGRAKRPEMFKQEAKKRKVPSKKKCPFCKIETQEFPLLVYSKGKEIKISKDYPAFMPYSKLDKQIEGGIYQRMNAVGFHEVIITRSHTKHIPHFSIEETKELIDVYQKRYLDLMNKRFVNHISIFHNYGPKAGASIAHPHSQLITTPLIDVDLNRALERSKNYFKKNKKCIYCRFNKWEMKVKKRIVFENKNFLVICPFASKTAFQIIISPKKHLAYFEEITNGEKWEFSEAFNKAMKAIYKALNDPDYNFYLHTAPCDGKDNSYYHWHWTIIPKTSIWAGFEIGTRMEISTIEPEKAAEYLRKQIK